MSQVSLMCFQRIVDRQYTLPAIYRRVLNSNCTVRRFTSREIFIQTGCISFREGLVIPNSGLKIQTRPITYLPERASTWEAHGLSMQRQLMAGTAITITSTIS